MGIVTRLFDSIEGIYWFPIIALLIFTTFFVAMVAHTLTMRKNHENEFGRLPLDNDETNHIQES